jgi:ATP-dependent DNA helicase RecG
MPLILANAPDVAFREIARLFVASFERPSAAVEAPKTTKQTTKETPKKHTRNTKELVLKALQAQPDVTAKALALALKLSEASVRHHLRVLQAAQRIRHVGPTKGGHWEVLDA